MNDVPPSNLGARYRTPNICSATRPSFARGLLKVESNFEKFDAYTSWLSAGPTVTLPAARSPRPGVHASCGERLLLGFLVIRSMAPRSLVFNPCKPPM